MLISVTLRSKTFLSQPADQSPIRHEIFLATIPLKRELGKLSGALYGLFVAHLQQKFCARRAAGIRAVAPWWGTCRVEELFEVEERDVVYDRG